MEIFPILGCDGLLWQEPDLQCVPGTGMAQNSAHKLDGHVIERLDLVCKDDDDTK